MTLHRRASAGVTAVQRTLDQIPTDDPAPYIVWTTRTVRMTKGSDPETWEFQHTTCKGHTFLLGCLAPVTSPNGPSNRPAGGPGSPGN